jgi:hypothetical protein
LKSGLCILQHALSISSCQLAALSLFQNRMIKKLGLCLWISELRSAVQLNLLLDYLIKFFKFLIRLGISFIDWCIFQERVFVISDYNKFDVLYHLLITNHFFIDHKWKPVHTINMREYHWFLASLYWDPEEILASSRSKSRRSPKILFNNVIWSSLFVRRNVTIV